MLAGRRDARYWWALAIVLGLALGLRALVYVVAPEVHHPDQIFQTLEQAHRLVFGWGATLWEQEYGVRSWLLPGALALVVAAASLLSADPVVYLGAVATVCILLSLIAPLVAFDLAYRQFGLTGAVIAAVVPATWVDLVYFAPHTLSEPIATHALLLAAFLTMRTGLTPRDGVAIGALLGLTFLLRFHFAFAIAAVVLWCLIQDRACGLRVVLSGIGVVIGGGFLDLLTLGLPWQSIWLNFYLNIVYRVSQEWGAQPWYWYIDMLLTCLSGGGIALLFFSAASGRSGVLLLSIAAIVLLTHSAVAHKEYRFIYPAIELGAVAAGLGLARVVEWCRHSMRSGMPPGMPHWAQWTLVAAGVGLMPSISAATAISPPYQQYVFRRNFAVVQAARLVREQPDLCGIGLRVPLPNTGGYSHWHRQVPLIDLSSLSQSEGFAALAPGFNVLVYVAGQEHGQTLGYVPLGCERTVCVARRAGSCEAVSSPPGSARPRPLRNADPADVTASVRAWALDWLPAALR